MVATYTDESRGRSLSGVGPTHLSNKVGHGPTNGDKIQRFGRKEHVEFREHVNVVGQILKVQKAK